MLSTYSITVLSSGRIPEQEPFRVNSGFLLKGKEDNPHTLKIQLFNERICEKMLYNLKFKDFSGN